jgi:hypothetical protein
VIDPWRPLRGRLGGKHVILIAALPAIEMAREPVLTSPVLETEEAVVSLVRAVVGAGGRVTVIAESSLAVLAGVVAGEYAVAQVDESPARWESAVTLVVTDRDEEDEEDPLGHLSAIGYVSVSREGKKSALLERSRFADALVCAGDNSAADVTTFREANRTGAPVFTIAATGDRARALAETSRAVLADVEVDRLAKLPTDESHTEANALERETSALPPVALTAQWIVEQLLNRSEDRGPEERRLRS